MSCGVNPVVGKEKQWGEGTLRPTTKPKTVIVIGGGPAGMEAARVAALRGHQVTLYEKEKKLGGHMNLLGKLPGRTVYLASVAWFERQLKKLNVTVHTGREFMASDLNDKMDVVIVAAGSRYRRDGVTGMIAYPIPGWDQDHVFVPEGALANLERIKSRVVILDDESFEIGPGLAQMLAERGLPVEYVTRMPMVAPLLALTYQSPLIYRALYGSGVKITLDHHIKTIDGRRVTLYNVYTNQETVINDVGAVILVTIRQTVDNLATELADRAPKIYLIGDALAPRRYGEAVMDGHSVGREI
jgi:pyruvate/2-oxoglutarate dehydrogenase complex dihydrolipoamide dehydrogenase (E3) component